MRKVKSSAISEVGYNPFWVTVRFTSGKKYRYYGVTYKDYKRLRDSDSVGRTYNKEIKGKYTSLEVA